jgi:acetyl-CoA/propionyl-CoA carboxylase
LNEQNFIEGRLSTDYLERFGLINKMNKDAEIEARRHADAAIAAFLLHSEFVQNTDPINVSRRSSRQLSGWTGLTSERNRRM